MKLDADDDATLDRLVEHMQRVVDNVRYTRATLRETETLASSVLQQLLIWQQTHS